MAAPSCHADREHRVERAARLLRDERDLVAAHLREGLLVGLREVGRTPLDAPGAHRESRRQQAEDRVGGHALAAAGLSDQTHHPAGLDAQRDSRDERGTPVDAENQVLDDELAVCRGSGRGVRREVGGARSRCSRSAASRRPREVRARQGTARWLRRDRRMPRSARARARRRTRHPERRLLPAAADRHERRRRGGAAREDVGERVRRDDREREDRAGRHHHPRLLEDEARGGLDHATPGRLGRLGAEADEGEAGLHHDADAEEQHELDDDRGRHVRQHVAEARRRSGRTPSMAAASTNSCFCRFLA